MKKYLIVALVALSVITAFGFLIHQNKKLRRERDAYHNNTEVLLSEVERYQTKSGEQAVRVGELQLRGAELERYRADDAALIRDMGVKKKELEQLTKIQQQTIYKLQGKARDTVFVVVTPDRAAEVPARCAEHHDEWPTAPPDRQREHQGGKQCDGRNLHILLDVDGLVVHCF